jgi:hypothetical protein
MKCQLKKVWCLELSVVYEMVCADTKQRKENTCQLLQEVEKKYQHKLCHLIVGSRGLILDETIDDICCFYKPCKRDLEKLLKNTIKAVVQSSFQIWLQKDNITATKLYFWLYLCDTYLCSLESFNLVSG